MGQTQREWFLSKLNESQSSGVRWRILGSNDVFGQSPPDVFDGELLFGEDNWEGFPAERQLIIDWIIDQGITNVVSLAGGPHMGIAQKVFSTGEPLWNDSASYPVFTEFALDALSAPKLFESDNWVPYIETYEEEWSWVSPYFRLMVDGYAVMEIEGERVKVEYWINNDTKSQHTESVLDTSLCVYDGVVEFTECLTATTTTEDDSSDGEGKEEGLSDGAVIGITIAAAGVAGLIVFVAIFVFMKRSSGGNDKPMKPTHVQDASRLSTDNAGAATDDKQL